MSVNRLATICILSADVESCGRNQSSFDKIPSLMMASMLEPTSSLTSVGDAKSSSINSAAVHPQHESRPPNPFRRWFVCFFLGVLQTWYIRNTEER